MKNKLVKAMSYALALVVAATVALVPAAEVKAATPYYPWFMTTSWDSMTQYERLMWLQYMGYDTSDYAVLAMLSNSDNSDYWSWYYLMQYQNGNTSNLANIYGGTSYQDLYARYLMEKAAGTLQSKAVYLSSPSNNATDNYTGSKSVATSSEYINYYTKQYVQAAQAQAMVDYYKNLSNKNSSSSTTNKKNTTTTTTTATKKDETVMNTTALSAGTVTQVKNLIKGCENGQNVNIKMGNATVIDSDILAALQGRNVTIYADMGTYSWYINGKDIADSTANVNLGCYVNSGKIPSNVMNGITGYAVELSTYTNQLPLKGNLYCSIGTKGDKVVVYKYNGTKLTKVNTVTVDSDGDAVVKVNGGGTYLFVLK